MSTVLVGKQFSYTQFNEFYQLIYLNQVYSRSSIYALMFIGVNHLLPFSVHDAIDFFMRILMISENIQNCHGSATTWMVIIASKGEAKLLLGYYKVTNVVCLRGPVIYPSCGMFPQVGSGVASESSSLELEECRTGLLLSTWVARELFRRYVPFAVIAGVSMGVRALLLLGSS